MKDENNLVETLFIRGGKNRWDWVRFVRVFIIKFSFWGIIYF